MTDLERQLSDEFHRLANAAPEPSGVERFAAGLVRDQRVSSRQGPPRSVWQRWLLPVLAAVVVAVPVVTVAVLHSRQSGADRSAGTRGLAGRQWLLVDWRGTDGALHTYTGAPTAGFRIDKLGHVVLNDGCNTGSGDVAVSAHEFTINADTFGSTDVGCGNTPPIDALVGPGAVAWRVDRGTLTLASADAGTLTFTLPSDPAHIVNRSWVLQSWRGLDGTLKTYTGAARTFVLRAGGEFTLDDGCNVAAGAAIITPGHLSLLGSTTTKSCGSSFASLASGVIQWRIAQYGRLVLTSPIAGSFTFASKP